MSSATQSGQREAGIPDLMPMMESAAFRRGPKRARAACELCRQKKVRCISRDGEPCPNCVYENVRCVQPPRNPRKLRRKSASLRLNGKPWSVEADAILQHANEALPVSKHSHVLAVEPQQDLMEKSPTSIEEMSPVFKDPRGWTCCDSVGASVVSQGRPPALSPLTPMSSISLPHYIRPLPATMDPDDIEYLRVKGALVVPESDLTSACLRAYFQHVQPMFPIVDLSKISSIVKGTNPNKETLSLLLFHTLIFVGSTWVDVRLVRRTGALSRKSYRQSIHQKIRLLYAADYEVDRLCLIQTFVLCTFWWEGPNETKDAWHRTGIALSLARTIDLHRSSPALGHTSSETERRLRKRLWWALVARDIISCFGLSRFPRISDTDYDVPMLEIEDFDLTSDSWEDGDTASISRQRTSAQICIAFLKLICIFGKIFRAAYPEGLAGKTAILFSSQQIEGTDKTPCRIDQPMIDQLRTYERELQSWRRDQVPQELWHTGPLPFNIPESERADFAHRGLLSALYHTSLLVLNRPLVSLSNQANTPENLALVGDQARNAVRTAAREITKIAMDFFVADLVDALSATVISCLIPASIVHVFDVTSSDQVVRCAASQQLEQCKAILQAFSDQQYAAAWSLNIINYIVGQIDSGKLREPVRAREGPKVGQSFQVSHQISGEILETGMLPSLAESNLSSPSTTTLSCNDMNFARGSTESRRNGRTVSDQPLMASLTSPSVRASGVDLSVSKAIPDILLANDFANFLGPDSMWLDFVSPSNHPGDFNWADSDLLLGNVS